MPFRLDQNITLVHLLTYADAEALIVDKVGRSAAAGVVSVEVGCWAVHLNQVVVGLLAEEAAGLRYSQAGEGVRVALATDVERMVAPANQQPQ